MNISENNSRDSADNKEAEDNANSIRTKDNSNFMRTEKKLHMTQFFVDKAAIMIFRVTPGGIIEYANEFACQKLNYNHREIRGLNVRTIISRNKFKNREEFWQKIKDLGSITFERVFIRKPENSRKGTTETKDNLKNLHDGDNSGDCDKDNDGNRGENCNEDYDGNNVGDCVDNYGKEKEYEGDRGDNYGKNSRKKRIMFPGEITSHYFEYQGEEYEFVFARDISQRKKAERRLKAREEQYRKIFTEAPIGLMIEDKEGNILEVNESFCEITGYQKEEIEGTNVVDKLTPPELLEKAEENIDLINSGEDIEFTVVSRRKNGEQYYSHLKETKIILPEKGEGILSMQIDLSELKEKEKKLEKQNYRIKKLHEMAIELKEINDRERVCQKTVEIAENVLEFRFCNIRLVEEGMLVNKAASSKSKVELEPRSLTENSIYSKTYREGKSFIVDDIENTAEADPVSSSYRSGISIPIGNQGVFQAVAPEAEIYCREDLELAELMISHTAAALKRIHYQKELKYKSFHDSLTGLYNRKFMEEEMKRLDTGRQLPISIIMVDINGLKIINDTYGHKKGDELLIKVADILRSSVRHEDITGRWGGDEFIILLPQTDKKAAGKVIQRIKQNCTATGDDEIPISMGIGTAVKGSPEQDMAEILDKADDVMYRNKLIESKSGKNKMVKSLLSALSAKSDETQDHALRIAEIAAKLGKRLGLSSEQLNDLSLLATLHDIGKVTIPEQVLRNPDKLSDEEWELIERHPEKGAQIAASTEEFAPVAKCIMAHHEQWDGKGYPQGLAGKEIPLLARIIAIVDAYDVMTNTRSYNKKVKKDEALKELKRCAGSQFDPELVEVFQEMMNE